MQYKSTPFLDKIFPIVVCEAICVYFGEERGCTVTLGERILILRRRLKLSQSELAKASALDKNTIARLEQGRVHDLSGATVVRVARALQVSTDVLLGVESLDAAGELEPADGALVPA